MFGKFSEGFKTLRPYRLPGDSIDLVEIPVTTMPVFKVPIHLSYVLYLGQFSPLLAMSYFRFAVMMCRITNVEPSLLLHPLDFLGKEDESDLGFFPAMNMESKSKLELAGKVIDYYASNFGVGTMMEHAERFGIGSRKKDRNLDVEAELNHVEKLTV